MAVTQAQVAQLYVALFNRAAEGEGLRNWMADGANKTVAQLADSMLQAPAVRTYFNGSIGNKLFERVASWQRIVLRNDI